MAATRRWTAALSVGALGLAAMTAVAQPPGDPAKGADVFDDHCSDCHALQGVHQGPSLVGVLGRKAGSLPGYDYTPAMKASGLTWNRAELDRFLVAPKKLVPGTAMEAVVVDPAERRDLIAYLATLKPPGG
jgi:cytochrome c2